MTVREELNRWAGDGSPLHQRLALHIIGKCDVAALERIASQGPEKGVTSGRQKYAAIIRMLDEKVGLERALGLTKMPPMTVLDIGAGAGHLGVLLSAFGHSVTGTNPRAMSPYGECHSAYRLPLIHHTLEPGGDLPPGNWDAIIATQSAFYFLSDGSLWTMDDWRHFLDLASSRLIGPRHFIVHFNQSSLRQHPDYHAELAALMADRGINTNGATAKGTLTERALAA